MSIERRSDGKYRTNTTYGHLGRVRRSLGTTSKRDAQARDALLLKLWKMERFDLLEAFRDGRLEIERLVDADRREALGTTMADLELDRNLWETIEAMLPDMGNTHGTRKRYRTSLLTSLRSKGRKQLGPNAHVGALARVNWRALQKEWGAGPTDWMHLRRAISRFLSLLLGEKDHPFRREVMRNFPTAREEPRVTEVTPAMFDEIVVHMGDDYRQFARAAAITGMRIGEMMAIEEKHLNDLTCSILVPGTKTAGSRATLRIDPYWWPTIRRALPANFSQSRMEEVWKDAVERAGYEDIHFHDLRHCHGQWAIDKGVAQSKVQSSLRHTSAAMTSRYVARKDTMEVSSALIGVIARSA